MRHRSQVQSAFGAVPLRHVSTSLKRERGASDFTHMRVSDEGVECFGKLYQKHHGVALPKDEARVMLANLVKLYKLILQPLPNAKVTQLSKESTARSAREAS